MGLFFCVAGMTDGSASAETGINRTRRRLETELRGHPFLPPEIMAITFLNPSMHV